jgi:hypothetical protein
MFLIVPMLRALWGFTNSTKLIYYVMCLFGLAHWVMQDMTVALPGGASYPILVHRLTFDPPRLPIPYSVTLMR